MDELNGIDSPNQYEDLNNLHSIDSKSIIVCDDGFPTTPFHS